MSANSLNASSRESSSMASATSPSSSFSGGVSSLRCHLCSSVAFPKNVCNDLLPLSSLLPRFLAFSGDDLGLSREALPFAFRGETRFFPEGESGSCFLGPDDSRGGALRVFRTGTSSSSSDRTNLRCRLARGRVMFGTFWAQCQK
jgi:hypothetical protein